ncbi:DUF6318 family protein [Glutamicibacter sp. NPDC087344]|uniref:DUF6318 family protein n=1 Tax=Glutamicibacter sp. NPDC087344 TaxID=3363994 RepID=UPI00381E93C0
MSTRKIACVALIAASSIALVACESSPADPPSATPTESQGTSSGSPTPTATQSPTPSETEKYEPATADGPAKNVPVPEMPALAKENSESGSIAFLKHYLNIMNFSFESYNADPLKNLTSNNCQLCFENIIQGIEFNGAQGGWQVGGQYEYRVYSSKVDGKTALLGFSMRRQPIELYTESGVLADESPSDEIETHAVALLKFTDSWVVDSISINEQQ